MDKEKTSRTQHKVNHRMRSALNNRTWKEDFEAPFLKTWPKCELNLLDFYETKATRERLIPYISCNGRATISVEHTWVLTTANTSRHSMLL